MIYGALSAILAHCQQSLHVVAQVAEEIDTTSKTGKAAMRLNIPGNVSSELIACDRHEHYDLWTHFAPDTLTMAPRHQTPAFEACA